MANVDFWDQYITLGYAHRSKLKPFTPVMLVYVLDLVISPWKSLIVRLAEYQTHLHLCTIYIYTIRFRLLSKFLT